MMNLLNLVMMGTLQLSKRENIPLTLASTPSVNLGFRPQWVWIYQNTHTGPRWVIDSTIGTNRTTPITTGTENTHGPNEITFTSTGFDIGNDANGNRSYLNQPGTYLYLAVAAP